MLNVNECHRTAHERLQQKQEQAVREHENRIRIITDEIPRIEAIRTELAENIRQFSLFAFSGDRSEEKFNEYKTRSLALQAERKELLRRHGYSENAFEEPYYCHLCKDQGYRDNKTCECFKRELSRVFLENSNLMRIYDEQTMDKYDLDYFLDEDGTQGQNYAHMEKIRKYLELYSRNFSEGASNLLFMGAPGCGKSFLSCAVAREVIDLGHFVYYSPAQEMLAAFEASRFDHDKNADTSVYKECDLLIIDDLGTEFKTQFSDSVLYDVINTRINMKKPMIISTNLSLDELKETYHDRICSRLINEFLNMPFVDVDVRQLKKLNKGKRNPKGTVQ